MRTCVTGTGDRGTGSVGTGRSGSTPSTTVTEATDPRIPTTLDPRPSFRPLCLSSLSVSTPPRSRRPQLHVRTVTSDYGAPRVPSLRPHTPGRRGRGRGSWSHSRSSSLSFLVVRLRPGQDQDDLTSEPLPVPRTGRVGGTGSSTSFRLRPQTGHRYLPRRPWSVEESRGVREDPVPSGRREVETLD